ncbi:uncharacterized protein K452DRAFT_362899 [Aplosporella prunicola CBS 121167]|uniref:Uncharacterized protein n=1 Tax=Aplosporella prunicola CBS 121167 TaxID=1176127 RepID=A0A6A6AV19_9PEZI|nr:uncharacterized protein K452DRAFT_362899 [Aplosporella prunicola CBS 121167]KAF2135872.1 hypothetical protein K452DRAFT_362899 [Aplosporella prunicola CBS 121167]
MATDQTGLHPQQRVIDIITGFYMELANPSDKRNKPRRTRVVIGRLKGKHDCVWAKLGGGGALEYYAAQFDNSGEPVEENVSRNPVRTTSDAIELLPSIQDFASCPTEIEEEIRRRLEYVRVNGQDDPSCSIDMPPIAPASTQSVLQMNVASSPSTYTPHTSTPTQGCVVHEANLPSGVAQLPRFKARIGGKGHRLIGELRDGTSPAGERNAVSITVGCKRNRPRIWVESCNMKNENLEKPDKFGGVNARDAASPIKKLTESISFLPVLGEFADHPERLWPAFKQHLAREYLAANPTGNASTTSADDSIQHGNPDIDEDMDSGHTDTTDTL